MPKDALKQSHLLSLPHDTLVGGWRGGSFLSQEVVYFPPFSKDPINNHPKHLVLSDEVLWKPEPSSSTRKSFSFFSLHFKSERLPEYSSGVFSSPLEPRPYSKACIPTLGQEPWKAWVWPWQRIRWNDSGQRLISDPFWFNWEEKNGIRLRM